VGAPIWTNLWLPSIYHLVDFVVQKKGKVKKGTGENLSMAGGVTKRERKVRQGKEGLVQGPGLGDAWRVL